MNNVKLYGPGWSAYTRTARLALIEKGIDYELVDVDFSSGVMPPTQLARQPFGKVPALKHDDFMLYETSAICRYIERAFDGPPLEPDKPRDVGRMAQIVAIIDAYLSAEIRLGLVNEGLIKPMMGASGDQVRFEKAYSATLAGLAAPLFHYLARAPRGNEAIDSQTNLRRWWDFIAKRPSITNTQPNLTVFGSRAD